MSNEYSHKTRLIMLNQMAGPLFRELAEDLSPLYKNGCLLITGHPDTLKINVNKRLKLVIEPAPGYNRGSNLKRVISWIKYTLFTSKYVLSAKPGDAIMLVSNPPILGGWVWLLTRFKGTPYSVLVYDIHPDGLIRAGVLKNNTIIVNLWRMVNRKVYENAKLLITIGKKMTELLNTQISSKTKDVIFLPMWVDVEKIKPLARKDNPYAQQFTKISDKFIILYSGNMGKSHDIDSILEAAKILRHRTDIKFVFIGDGERFGDVKSFIKTHKLMNISLFPFQPENLIRYTLPLADISLVSLDQGMEDIMVPSKTFYYLAAGSAILAIANHNSELADILDQNDCGTLIEPGRPDLLARNIESLISNPEELELMKINARALAENRYSRKVCSGEFAKHLKLAKLL